MQVSGLGVPATEPFAAAIRRCVETVKVLACLERATWRAVVIGWASVGLVVVAATSCWPQLLQLAVETTYSLLLPLLGSVAWGSLGVHPSC